MELVLLPIGNWQNIFYVASIGRDTVWGTTRLTVSTTHPKHAKNSNAQIKSKIGILVARMMQPYIMLGLLNPFLWKRNNTFKASNLLFSVRRECSSSLTVEILKCLHSINLSSTDCKDFFKFLKFCQGTHVAQTLTRLSFIENFLVKISTCMLVDGAYQVLAARELKYPSHERSKERNWRDS